MINANNLIQFVIDSIPDRIFWKDKSGKYLGANIKFASDAGTNTVANLIGKTDFQLAWTKEQAESFAKDDQEVMLSGHSKLHIEEPQTQNDGLLHWLDTTKVPLQSNSGETIGILGMYRDITEEKNIQLATERMAHIDLLTQIPNRIFLEKAINDFKDNNTNYSALLLIDLDYFKTVNDTWGHYIGDILLKEVASKLKKSIGSRGIFARMGGDEFSVFIQDYHNLEQLRDETAKLSEDLLQNFNSPFLIENYTLYLGASIGVTFCNGNAFQTGQLYREADLALYQAKSERRNTYAFFSKEMKKAADLENEMLMNLRQAADKNEFHLVYQPQFNAEEKHIGAEVLMRWKQADGSFIPPDQFIPLAEKAGVIHQLGSWLLDESKCVQERRSYLNKFTRLAINISPIQFEQDNFEDLLINKLLATGLPASLFEIEVTESLLLKNQKVAFNKLRKLREQGFSIAIDDFGTGYSSLSYLSQLPVDKLKIDRSFVMKLFDDKRNQIIVKMILEMANSLGIKTVAEGVETKEEFEFLKAHNCDLFQGYYFSKPIQENQYCIDY